MDVSSRALARVSARAGLVLLDDVGMKDGVASEVSCNSVPGPTKASWKGGISVDVNHAAGRERPFAHGRCCGLERRSVRRSRVRITGISQPTYDRAGPDVAHAKGPVPDAAGLSISVLGVPYDSSASCPCRPRDH